MVPSFSACVFMLFLYLNNRSIALIQAWLDETQSAITQAHQHLASNQSRLPTPWPSSSRSKITLTSAEGTAMNSPKGDVELDAEDPSTPKRRQLLTHSDNTPHASLTKTYHASSIDQGIPGSSDMLATPSTQSSKSTSSSRNSPVKGFRFLLMTENPVVRSDELSEIPSMGRDLYAHLARVRSALGVIPRALKACVVIECDQYLANCCRTPSQRWAQIGSCMT